MIDLELELKKLEEEADKASENKKKNPVKDFILENKKLIASAKRKRVPVKKIAELITLKAREIGIIENDKTISSITIGKYVKVKKAKKAKIKENKEGK